MKKKNTRGPISPLYLLLQVEGQKGRVTREVIARKTMTKGTCITFPKILVGFVPTKKGGEKGCNAFPLLRVETNNMKGMVCFQHFILHEHNKIQRELLPFYFHHCEVKTNKQ
jgi:hypothetical protein